MDTNSTDIPCDCGDHGEPIEGPFHAHHCNVTQRLLTMTAGGPRYHVDIPQHVFKTFQLDDYRFGDCGWPTEELARGALHRLVGAYPEKLVLLFRDHVVIDAQSLECGQLYRYALAHNQLYDWETGDKILKEPALEAIHE